MSDLSRLLAGERELERRVAADANPDQAVNGWTAALMFFHVAQWRSRLLSALADHAQGKTSAFHLQSDTSPPRRCLRSTREAASP